MAATEDQSERRLRERKELPKKMDNATRIKQCAVDFVSRGTYPKLAKCMHFNNIPSIYRENVTYWIKKFEKDGTALIMRESKIAEILGQNCPALILFFFILGLQAVITGFLGLLISFIIV